MNLKSIRRKLFLMGLLKIPVIGFVRPKLISLSEESSQIRIKLTRRTKNHLGSMYFGAMMVGAELAAGVFVLQWMEQNRNKFSFVFSQAEGDFTRRAETDIIFHCDNGLEVHELFELSRQTGERQSASLSVYATNSMNEEIAEFRFTLSVRVKN